ncbi:MAG: GNAT family N-acetyltransferase [Proteobacteria bacterium]|nr:GNAT family N-acetyltransferase [Pseudomonadota bacterium]
MFELSFLIEPNDNQKKQILSIYHKRKWWPETVNDPERIHRIVQGSHCFVLAMDGDNVAGMGRALSDKTGDAYIHDVTVEEKFRHQGLGRLIVRKIIDRLVQDGITWVGLIAEQNSHIFYEKENFQTMGKAVPMFKWVP